jgi:hypothetical protein
MRNISQFALWAALAALCACGSNDTIDDTDVSPDSIWGSYEAHFDARDNSLRLLAQFRVGGSTGTTVRLTSPAKVEVGDQTMNFVDGDESAVNLSGSFYTLRQSLTTPPESQRFRWTRNDGQVFVNTVRQAPALSVASPAPATTVPRDAPLTITFEGEPLADGDRITAYVDTQVSDRSGYARVDITSGSTLVVPSADLAEMPAGKATVRLQRYREGRASEGHPKEGGRLLSSFASEAVEITFAE